MRRLRFRRLWALALLAAACLVGGTNAGATDPKPSVGFADGSTLTVTAPGPGRTVNLTVKLTSSVQDSTDTSTVTWTIADTTDSGNTGGGSLTFNLDGSNAEQTIPVKLAGLRGGTITVTLANEDGKVDLGAKTATITVNAAPTVAVADKTVAGAPGPFDTTLPVTLSAAAAKDVAVSYTVADGTAKAGTDYVASSGTVTIAAGATVAHVPITIKGATKGGTFTVTLTGVTSGNASLGNAKATITITPAPIPKVAVQDLSVQRTAQDSLAQVPITIAPASGVSPITVDYVLTEGTASYGSDFENVDTRLTIPVGETSGAIPVRIRAGTKGGTFSVTLKTVSSNAQIQRATATITIVGQAAALPKVSVSPLTLALTDTQIPVRLSSATTSAVTVNYSASNGTALSGTDYTLAPGTLTFGAGQTVANLPVTVKAGTKGGTFTVNLSNPSSNATLGTASATITISAGAVTPKVSIADATFAVATTDTPATLTVTLSSASATQVTANYSAADGTARNGTDYALSPGTVTFPANTLTQTIPFTLKAGGTGGSFTVTLSGPSGATLDATASSATVTIVNGPALSIADTAVAENATTGKATLTVTLVGSPAGPVSVDYTTGNGTAVTGVDYVAAQGTLTFAAGEKTKTIDIVIVDNQQISTIDKTFKVTLSNAKGAALARPQATVTIVDDESGSPATGNNGVGFGNQVVGGVTNRNQRPGSTGSTQSNQGGTGGGTAGSNGGNSNSKTGGDSGPNSGGKTTGKSGSSAASKLTIVPLSRAVGADRLLRLRVTCPKTAAARCVGSVSLATLKTSTAKAQALGRASIALKQGGTGIVAVHLARPITLLLKKQKAVKTVLTVTITSGSTLSIATQQMVLQRPMKAPAQPSIVVTNP